MRAAVWAGGLALLVFLGFFGRRVRDKGENDAREVLAAGVLIRFFDTVLRAYCTFDTVEASVMIAKHVRDRKLVLTSAMSCRGARRQRHATPRPRATRRATAE